ncbi:MAG: DUF4830 domain-containing protein [Oscillospiraceae bacterium]|nr:DUF4830 domain-containing protein [Oscillospiraceae bacterium]
MKTVKVKEVLKALFTIFFIALAVLAVVLFVKNLTADNSVMLDTEAARQEFLSSIGWQVSGTPIDVREVTIPTEWNDVFEEYNSIQKQQGFDLEKHKGDNVTIYTYEVYNYEGKPENMVANLMVYNGELIGGDVSCTELGGFIQGLLPIPAE